MSEKYTYKIADSTTAGSLATIREQYSKLAEHHLKDLYSVVRQWLQLYRLRPMDLIEIHTFLGNSDAYDVYLRLNDKTSPRTAATIMAIQYYDDVMDTMNELHEDHINVDETGIVWLVKRWFLLREYVGEIGFHDFTIDDDIVKDILEQYSKPDKQEIFETLWAELLDVSKSSEESCEHSFEDFEDYLQNYTKSSGKPFIKNTHIGIYEQTLMAAYMVDHGYKDGLICITKGLKIRSGSGVENEEIITKVNKIYGRMIGDVHYDASA